ncbi:uncharacterized protein J3D65DRAFT_662623 [Phyllosticta citribraziliensis]|uniref:Uncharacterized protein n=1 Tax=Phyllosticta citribraziliensis TaxID=989973 RepID=A0ABR1L6N0_9PEZI
MDPLSLKGLLDLLTTILCSGVAVEARFSRYADAPFLLFPPLSLAVLPNRVVLRALKGQRPSAGSVIQPAIPSYMRSTASSRSRACPASVTSVPRRPGSPSPSSQAPIPLTPAPTVARHAPCPPSLVRFGFLGPAAPADEVKPINEGNFARLLVRVLEGKHRDKTLPGRLDAFRKAQEKSVLEKARLRRNRVLGFSCQEQIPIFSAAAAAPHLPRSVH